MLNERWEKIIDQLEYAYQPIVNVYTGNCFGFEALMRQTENAGFRTAQELLDAAYFDQTLYAVDLKLREKAVAKFAQSGLHQYGKLFINVDARILEMPDYRGGNSREMLHRYDLPMGAVCFEVSQKSDPRLFIETKTILRLYKDQGFRMVLDDFGAGFSGFKTLFHSDVDYIKIDRFLIADFHGDIRKKLFITNLVSTAQALGITVIAEGVESAKEFLACKDAGCTLAQGHFIQHPETSVEKTGNAFPHVVAAIREDRRERNDDRKLLQSRIERIDAISTEETMNEVFARFRTEKDRNFLPVVDKEDQPVGIIRENDLKEYVYSAYGRDLLMNKSVGKSLKSFVTPCAVVDIHTDAEKILHAFSASETDDGVVVVDNLRYLGVLGAKSLLDILNEKNIQVARNQNPLTKLPGNGPIGEYLHRSMAADTRELVSFVYFDFDNFKPYNDKYGFRQGDRAILLFADILKKEVADKGHFIGHIGGDDFFAGFVGSDFEKNHKRVKKVNRLFKEEVEDFYSPEDRERGYIEAKSREGELRRFPLLTVSAAIVEVNASCCAHPDAEGVSALIADLKKLAKQAPDKVAVAGYFCPTVTV